MILDNKYSIETLNKLNMRLMLRPITLGDTSILVKWKNDVNVIEHSLSRETKIEENNRELYYNIAKIGKYKQFIVECLVDNYPVKYPITTVYLNDIDDINKCCELCFFTGTDKEWQFETQCVAIKMLLEKAFNEYDMLKVYSYMLRKFSDEIEMLKKIGFTIETISEKVTFYDDGKYEEIVKLVIYKG